MPMKSMKPYMRRNKGVTGISMAEETGGWTRPGLLTLAIGVATALSVAVCIALVLPFLPAVIWSITLAIVIQPVYRRLAFPQYPGIGAALAVLAVTLIIVVPLLTLGFQAANEATKALQGLGGEELVAKWQVLLDAHPSVAKAMVWLQHQFNIKQQVQRLAESLGDALPAFIGGSLSILMQLLITLFVLFFCCEIACRSCNGFVHIPRSQTVRRRSFSKRWRIVSKRRLSGTCLRVCSKASWVV